MSVKKPWGSYTILSEGENFKIKLIEILPGQRLSIQKHKDRDEHWTILEGVAKVINNKKDILLKKKESIFVSKGTLHRIENQTAEILRIAEVQYGQYLEEDDIERFADDYGRLLKDEG